jgi:outer membrane receptor protein involved in Fe transport
LPGTLEIPQPIRHTGDKAMSYSLGSRTGTCRKPGRAVRGRLIVLTLTATALLLALPQETNAQVLYGSLTGNVTDASGGVAVGVKVQALNVGTNVAKSATTNDRGVYLFSDLLPGVYDVSFETQGFKNLAHKGVRVDSNTVRRVDARLEVSGVTETVEVTAPAAPLQTDRADIHVTQSAKQVNDLPLAGSLGRNYQSLMQIVPGATIMRTENGQGEANSVAGSPQRAISFSANGVSGWLNQTKIDGSPVQYFYLPTNTAYVPSAEAIEEVSIVTNSYSAEQGTAAGAAVNVVVKSGTNTYHATAWVYDTNSELRARNVFQTTPNNPKNIVMQYGANVGGPIIKDKLFFFFNTEKTTQRVGAGSRRLSIAPESLRPNAAGNVVFPTPAQGGAIIYDPLSSPDPSQRTPFPNNTIPGSRIDQAAQYMLGQLPATTSEGYVNNVVTTGATEYDRTNYDIKVNYAASTRLMMFARYGNSPHDIYDDYALGGAGGGSAAGGSVGLGVGRTQVLGVGATYTFGPTTVLDANFGWTHQKLGAEAPDIDVNVGSDADKMNIPGTNGPDRMQGGLPSFQISNWSNLGNDGTGNPFQFDDYQYTASLNLQKLSGPHTFRLGGEYLNQQINHFQPQGGAFQTVRGTFIFSGQSTMLQGAPAPADVRFNSWAAFLLGMPSGNNPQGQGPGAGKVEQLLNPNSINMDTWAAYLQDTWQVNRALTVSLGLRWEIYRFPYRPDGKGVGRFDPADGYVYVGGYGDVPQDTYASSGNGQLLPRAGVIYRLNDKTVLRAGYGRTADPRNFTDFRNSYPINFVWTMAPIKYNGVDNPYLPVTTFRQGLIPPSAPPDLNQGKILLPAGVGTITYPKEANRKHIDSFNIAVQRELAPWMTFQAAYVGTRAIGQMNYVNINAGAPGTGTAGRALYASGLTNVTSDITMVQPYGDTVYNGLQTELRVRSSRAQGGVAYTWSKTTNYADNGGGNAAGAGGPRIQYMPEKERNKGLAGYDRTHNFQAYGFWDLPFGEGRQWATSGWKSALFGGWQINGILSIMSGTPIYIIQNTGFNLNASGSSQVPDLIKGTVATYPDNKVNRPPSGADPNQYQYFDRSAYQAVNIPASEQQRFGNSPRNSIRGPGFWNVDLGLFRTINLPRNANLQLRFEALNAFNHPNFSNPGNNVSDAAAFGFITSTTGVGERNIRFGIRLAF